MLGTVSPATGQSTFSFDNQGWTNGQIITAPVTITEGSFTLSFEDVNTSIPDFEYRTARTGDLNYQSSGQLDITTDSGGEINAQSIDLGFVDGVSIDGDPVITGASVTITGYRNGTQVAQFTDNTNIVGGTNTEIGLSSRDPGFGNVDKITVKANSITGGSSLDNEFLMFDNVTVGPAVSPQPDIAVEDSDGTSIPNGDTSPSPGESTDFGGVAVAGNSVTTYTIRNTGTGTLNVSNITSSNTSEFTVSGIPGSIAAGSSGTFDVTFAPSAGGTRSATITITSDDPDAEGTYSFAVEGEGLVPDIAITDDGSNPLPDGSGTFDFGTVNLGSTSERFFRITNTGDANLSLNGLPEIQLSGTNAGDFSVSASPSSPVSPGGQTSFAVTFDPQAAGTRTATVTIPNNDPDEDPYTFEVTGTGNDPNTAPTASGSISPTSLNDNAGPTALFDGIDVSDPDAGETDLTLRVTVANASAGVISGVNGTSVTNEGGGVFSVSGSFDPSTIDTALDNLRFSPTDNTGSSGTFNTDLTVQVDDQESGFVDVSGPTTVTVTRVNDAPTVALGAPSGSVDENNSPPTVLTSVTVNDPDGGTNDLSLSGTDASAFQIDGTDLEFADVADFETKSSYTVTVNVDDTSVGTTPDDSETFTLSINDVNEPPVVATNTGLLLDEGATATIGTGALNATDEDAGDGASTLTFNVTSAVSNGTLFIDGSTGGTDDGTLDGESGIGTGSFTQAIIDSGNLLYAHDGSGTTTDSFTFDLTDDSGAGPTGITFSIGITTQNDAPTISDIPDQTIEEDAPLDPVSFTVDDTETAASNLTVTATSDNQALVPDANITLGGSATDRTVAVTPAANASGTATITVTVDDGAASNNTRSTSFVLTVTAVPDLTLTDGSASGLDFSGSVTPGTTDNPVGVFALSAGQNGASFDGVTVTNTAPGVAGITAARLYWSDNQTLEPGSDAVLATFDVDETSAESAFSFGGFSQTIPGSARYAILAIDVQSGATGDVQFELSQPSDLSLSGGEIATVNGSSQNTFAGLLLSNGSTALPVELVSFEVQARNEAVLLQWETTSETNNAGFAIQRAVQTSRRDDVSSPPNASSAWQEVGFVAGAGTTTDAQSYRFADATVPYAADSLTYRLKQVDTDGSVSFSKEVTVRRGAVQQLRLLGTFPNPARTHATVRFAVPKGADDAAVRLVLYDVLGRQVRTVRTAATAGRHELQLRVGGLASGLYFLRLQAGGRTQTQKITVVQ
ncbi:choice-of-anchor D domain-containing protein [Salisaeta longa]|uniref:choice-of-anchor D domain-containing protein n=1 Tax=Salisaeta longa TaxID=503170 RepID=UPI00146E1080|nr:choice-of-anchor D domain-containing protein [Salisaeta longa]